MIKQVGRMLTISEYEQWVYVCSLYYSYNFSTSWKLFTNKKLIYKFTNYVEMSILPKLTYQSDIISIKLLLSFLGEINKLIQKFI